jgi:hypothetical protein
MVEYPVEWGLLCRAQKIVYRIGLMSYCFVRSTCIVISVVSTALMAIHSYQNAQRCSMHAIVGIQVDAKMVTISDVTS